MKKSWIIGPATALLGLTLALTACGGDDDNSASSTGTATATAVATETSDATSTPKSTATAKKTSTPKETATPEDTPDFSTPEIDECRLVQPSDLASLASDTFDDGTLVGDLCTFNGDGGTMVSIQTYNLGDNAQNTFEVIPLTFDDEILNDPGDEAYYDTDLGLAILRGSIELDILVTDAAGTNSRDSAFAISEVALPNMP
jgi:hypothetical protein